MHIDEIAAIAREVLEDHRTKVIKFVLKRKRFELWYQSEIFHRMQSRNPDRQMEREHPYHGSQEHCDLWLDNDGQETWVELKCCVTNYATEFTGPFSNRNITNEINDIIWDADKLRNVAKTANRQILFIAYPMPDDYRSKPEWSAHLEKLRVAGIGLSEAFVLPLQRSRKTTSIVGYQGDV